MWVLTTEQQRNYSHDSPLTSMHSTQIYICRFSAQKGVSAIRNVTFLGVFYSQQITSKKGQNVSLEHCLINSTVLMGSCICIPNHCMIHRHSMIPTDWYIQPI